MKLKFLEFRDFGYSPTLAPISMANPKMLPSEDAHSASMSFLRKFAIKDKFGDLTRDQVIERL